MKKLSVLFAVLFSSVQMLNAQYCVPPISCDANITTVAIIDGSDGTVPFNNTSGCENYGDFTNLGPIDLNVGAAYVAEVVSNNTTIGINNTNVRGYVLWVDYDQSETFEEIEATFLPHTGGVAAELAFTVPPTALTGLTRMRVRWDIATPLTGPWDNAFACRGGAGEVEDYTVNIINPTDLTPACAKIPVPADAASDLCNIGTTLSFTAPDADTNPLKDPTGYLLSLWTDNGTVVYLEEDLDLLTATSFTITDVLTPGETYYWQVKPYNDTETNEGCTAWSFTTAPEPNPAPVIAVDGDGSRLVEVCAEAEALFSITDVNSTDLSGATYDWNGTDNTSYPLNDTTIADPVFNSTDFGTTYELALLVTDQYSCVGVDTVNVFVKERATPGTIAAPAGTKVCEGETTELTLSGYNGSITWKYSFTSVVSGLVNTGDVDSVHLTMPITQNAYYIAVVDLNGCTDTASVFIEKKDLPFKPSTLNGGLSFCEGDSTYLQAVWPVTGTLTWDDASMSNTEVIWIKESGTFSVTGTADASGCSNTSDPVTVTKNDNPNNPMVLEMGGNACSGDSVAIQVAISGADSLFWIDNDGYNNNLDLNITDDASYLFVNKLNTGCHSDTIAYNVVFGDTPTKPIINTLSNDSLQVIGNATTYYWYTEDGTLVSNETDDIFEPTENGTYYVVVGNGSCLSEPSDTVVVDLHIGITDLANGLSQIKVYPNPTNGFFKVLLPSSAVISIVGIDGKLIEQVQGQKGENVFDLNLQSGIYFVECQFDGANKTVDRIIFE